VNDVKKQNFTHENRKKIKKKLR